MKISDKYQNGELWQIIAERSYDTFHDIHTPKQNN